MTVIPLVSQTQCSQTKSKSRYCTDTQYVMQTAPEANQIMILNVSQDTVQKVFNVHELKDKHLLKNSFRNKSH